MKVFIKCISTIIAGLLLLCISPSADGSNASVNENQKSIILTKVHRGKHNGRNVTADVSATFYIEKNLIELFCMDTDETSVYILSSTGEEISCDGFNSDMTPSYTVEAPDTPGTYWIVIDSPVIYAEGFFVVE